MPLYLTLYFYFFFFTDTATPEIYTLSLHDALPIWLCIRHFTDCSRNLSGSHLILDFSIWPNLTVIRCGPWWKGSPHAKRSEEHTSELQSLRHLVCRLLLEKKNKKQPTGIATEIEAI